MVARRVASFPNENSGVACPTGKNAPTENKAKKTALSNRKGRFGSLVATEHKRMSRMLGYCLTLGTANAWAGFSTVAAARLSDTERAALGFASLQSLSPDLAEITAAAALGAAGDPLPPFLGGLRDAEGWAQLATRAELKAYALAAYEAMTAPDQAAFFRHISTVDF